MYRMKLFILFDNVFLSKCPTCRQFHQHSMRSFFVRTLFWQLTCTYKKLLKQRLYEKFVRKMLMKLTPGILFLK
jgi:hypothetical protein